MQSFLQYRQIRQHLVTQLEKHKPHEIANDDNSHISRGSRRNSTDRDPEKGRQPGDLARDDRSREDNPSEWHDSVRRWHTQNSTTSYRMRHSSHTLHGPATQDATNRQDVWVKEDEEDKEEEEEVEEKVQEENTSNSQNLRREQSEGHQLGLSLTGIDVRDRTTKEGREEAEERDKQVFVVGFQGDDDPLNPHNYSRFKRWYATFLVASIGAVVGVAASIDSSALSEASADFGVSEVVESLAIGVYLMGFGVGALVAGPFSETAGRNPIYVATLSIYCIFIMASALAPSIGAQLAFRFVAGVFGATPLTCAGGSVSDLWNPLERVYTFPVFAVSAFMGPIIGPVMGGFIAESQILHDWRWTEWITLIMSGLVLVLVALFQPETYAPVILMWKAKHLRDLTGDDRYVAPLEVAKDNFAHRLQLALYRPFLLTFYEPIVMLVALYLTVIYIILFTFFDGYNYIFADIHGTSQGVTGLCFLGIVVGLLSAMLLIPIIYHWAKRDLAKIKEQGGDRLPPEFRLWFSMLGGSIAIPVSLFWLGWTSDPNISIWSPLAASVLFGYGILCVFITSYQYLIDAYETYAASALASATLIRYVAAGGMVVVGIPFYENMGVHYTLTILGCIAALMAPVPYIFYIYGARIRAKSKFAVSAAT